jgi:hypothetical protein
VQEALADDPTLEDFQLLQGVDRSQEPVTFGLPLPPDSGISRVEQLGLAGAQVGQFRVLQRWPNGNIQWVLVDTQADVAANAQNHSLMLTGGAGNFGGSNLAADQGNTISVDTGAAQFTVRKQGFNLLDRVVVGGFQMVAPGASPGVELIGDNGVVYRASNDSNVSVAIEENGPARAVIVARGTHRSGNGQRHVQFTVRMHFYRGKSRVKVFYTMRNASLQQVENVPFQSLELALATTLQQPTFRIANHTGETTGPLGQAENVRIFQGENSFPNFRDYDFTDFDNNGNLITTRWPTTIAGYTIRKNNGQTVMSGDRTQLIDLFYAQAAAGGRAVTFGTRFAAGWWPQGLAVDGNGMIRVGLFPPGNDRPYYARFCGHVTREVLLDFAASPPNAREAFFRFQYPLVGKAQNVDWYNRSGAIWERLLSVEEEAGTYRARGWSWQDLLERRPDFVIYRHYYWGTGGGDNQYDFTKVDLHNFLRRGERYAGGHYLNAEQRLAYNADLSVYHSDDFDASRDDAPFYEELPNAERVPSAKAIFEGEHRHAYGLGLWYYLSGDERIREAYIDWGDWLHHFQARGFNPYERGLIWNIYNLVDLYRFTGDRKHRDLAWEFLRDEVLNRTAVLRVSPGTDWQRGFYASWSTTFEDPVTPWPERFLTSFVMGAMFPRGYAYFHDFGAANELEADRARDVLEGITRFMSNEHWYEYAPLTVRNYGFPYVQSLDRPRDPPDAREEPNWWGGFKEGWLTFYYGYVTTGDSEFLRRGELLQQAAAFNPESWTWYQDWPDRQRLQHLLEHPDQYAVWRDLPLMVRDNGGGSYTLSWTVPAGARQYWIKYADKPIVPWLNFDRVTRRYQFDPAAFTAFFAATNLTNEPAPAAPGSAQSLTVTGLPAGARFAARCLTGP